MSGHIERIRQDAMPLSLHHNKGCCMKAEGEALGVNVAAGRFRRQAFLKWLEGKERASNGN